MKINMPFPRPPGPDHKPDWWEPDEEFEDE